MIRDQEGKKVKLRSSYLIRVGDATSQFFNVLFLNGDPNESISGRSFREQWNSLQKLIDTILSPLEKSHCENAYITDILRAKDLVKYDQKNRPSKNFKQEDYE